MNDLEILNEEIDDKLKEMDYNIHTGLVYITFIDEVESNLNAYEVKVELVNKECAFQVNRLITARNINSLVEILEEELYYDFKFKSLLENPNQKLFDFEVWQNNSGGHSFKYKKCIKNVLQGEGYNSDNLILFAENKEKALKLLNKYVKKIGDDLEYCECCGERWENIKDTRTGIEHRLYISNGELKLR